MARMKWLAVAAVLFLMFSATASAASSGIKVRPGTYDPDKTGCPKAAWVAKAGLPDAGKSNHALILEKNCLTTDNSAAGAVVDGVEGLPADGEYGYDIK